MTKQELQQEYNELKPIIIRKGKELHNLTNELKALTKILRDIKRQIKEVPNVE